MNVFRHLVHWLVFFLGLWLLLWTSEVVITDGFDRAFYLFNYSRDLEWRLLFLAFLFGLGFQKLVWNEIYLRPWKYKIIGKVADKGPTESTENDGSTSALVIASSSSATARSSNKSKMIETNVLRSIDWSFWFIWIVLGFIIGVALLLLWDTLPESLVHSLRRLLGIAVLGGALTMVVVMVWMGIRRDQNRKD